MSSPRIVIFRFLWFLAVSKPIREKIDVGSRICAQLVVTNSKINIYRHAPRCRQVLNSKNLIEFPASFFITVIALVAQFCPYYSLFLLLL